MSPSIMVQSGPASTRERSITWTPASAPSKGLICSNPRPLAPHRGWRVEVARAAVEISLKLALVAHAEFLEIGLSSFQKGVHALQALLGTPDVREQFHAVLPGGVEQ